MTVALRRISLLRLPFHCFNRFMGCSTLLLLRFRPVGCVSGSSGHKKRWCLGQQNHKLWYDLMGQQTVVVVREIDFSLKVYCWRRENLRLPIAFMCRFLLCKVETSRCLFRSCLLYDQRVLSCCDEIRFSTSSTNFFKRAEWLFFEKKSTWEKITNNVKRQRKWKKNIAQKFRLQFTTH